MKKHFKFLFSIIMAIIFVLPFAAFGCDIQPENKQPETHTITVTSNNANYGTVHGGGVFTEGEFITLVAVPKDGYEFQKWNDDDTNSVRRIQVTENQTYTATFVAETIVPETKYYALDKVEIYLEKYGLTTAKCVRLENVEICSQNNEISELKMGGNSMRSDDGFILMDYNPSGDSYQVRAGESSPVYFYSMQNEYNKFEQGATPTLVVSMTMHCLMSYYDADNNFVQENGTHGGGLVYNLPLIVQAISNNSTSTHLVYTDSNHGYKVYMKLNFVEL